MKKNLLMIKFFKNQHKKYNKILKRDITCSQCKIFIIIKRSYKIKVREKKIDVQ